MSKLEDFRTRLAQLTTAADTHPERFGEGVRLLFSCRSDNLPADLAKAHSQGIEARGVGRMHILVEVEDRVPDADWLAHEGLALAAYFDSIAGANPQVDVDRGPTDLPE